MSNNARIFERCVAARGPVEQVLVCEREWWSKMGTVEFKHAIVSMDSAALSLVRTEMRSALTLVQNQLAAEPSDCEWRRRAAAAVSHIQVKIEHVKREQMRRGDRTPGQLDRERQARDIATRAQREEQKEAAHKARMLRQREERALRLGALRDLAATDPTAAIQGLLSWLMRDYENETEKDPTP